MFYLAAFLSLLIGVLIYMMDPTPMDLRRSLDSNAGESFVIPFINQHQAAHDYLNHWLGRISPNNSGDEKWALGTNFSATDPQQVKVIAIPKAMMDFMPLAMRNTITDADGKETIYSEHLHNGVNSLLHSTGDRNGYVSVLACMNRAQQLIACYRSFSLHSPTPTVKLNRWDWATDVSKKYLITYGVHEFLYPALEGNVSTGSDKVLRQDLWVKALANRSNNSANCGFLVPAPNGQGWVYNNATVGSKRVRVDPGSDIKYCIHNGHQCLSVLPKSLQDYLERAISTQDLSDTFFCMSEISDPYAKVASMRYHFDGVDYQAKGAETGREKLYSVGESSGTAAYWVGVTGAADAVVDELYVEARNNLNNKIEMPFSQESRDFTLSFVVRHTATQNNTPLLNTQIPAAANNTLFSIMSGPATGSGDTTSQSFSYYPSDSTADSLSFERLIGNGRTFAWTVMRRNGQMRLYLNGCLLSQDKTPRFPVPGTLDKVVFGPLAGTGGDVYAGTLRDVRYYNFALTGKQIKDNFKIDMKRYGVQADHCLKVGATDFGDE